MDNVKRSVSLLNIFRHTHLKIGVTVMLFCCFTFLGSALYTLEALIKQNIKQYSEILLTTHPPEDTNPTQVIKQMSPLISNDYVSSIQIYNNKEVIEQLITTVIFHFCLNR